MRYLLVLLLAGCMTAPRHHNTEHRDTLGRMWLTCLHEEARKIDDGTSDPASVGLAVRGACVGKGRRYAESMVGGEPIDFRVRFVQQFEERQLDSAIRAVLVERKRRQ